MITVNLKDLFKSLTPADVNYFHHRSDVDSSFKAQHHTLGRKHNQAAPGDHTHDGIDSPEIIVKTTIVTSEDGTVDVVFDGDRTYDLSVDLDSTDIKAWWTDEIVYSGDGDVLIPLTYVPIPESEDVYWEGLAFDRDEWSRTDTLLTIPEETYYLDTNRFWVRYEYLIGARKRTAPTITDPVAGSELEHITSISGTGMPGIPIEIFVDNISIGTVMVNGAGLWTISTTDPAFGYHTIKASQTHGDGQVLSAFSNFQIIFVAPFITLVGTNSATGTISDIALPVGAQAGDLFVLASIGFSSNGSSDPRIEGTSIDGAGVLCAWGTLDSSGTPIDVNCNAGVSGYGATSLAVYRDVAVDHMETTQLTSSPFVLLTDPSQYACIGMLTMANGVIAGFIDNDSTANWTTDIDCTLTKAHAKIVSWDSATPVTNPAGSFVASGSVGGGVQTTLYLVRP